MSVSFVARDICAGRRADAVNSYRTLARFTHLRLAAAVKGTAIGLARARAKFVDKSSNGMLICITGILNNAIFEDRSQVSESQHSSASHAINGASSCAT